MIATRISREVLEAASRDAYLERFPTGRESAAPANVQPTLQVLGAGGVLRVPYAGIDYELGHVSFADGVRLLAAKAKVEVLKVDDDLTAENLTVYLEGMAVVVKMAPKYLRPVSRWRRSVSWLRRNPFRSATDAEVGQLLGFFLASRMRSRVRLAATPDPELGPTS